MNANKQIVNSHSLITLLIFNHLYQYIHCTNVSIPHEVFQLLSPIDYNWQDLSLQGFLYFPNLPSSCLLWTQFFGQSIQVPGLSEFGYLNQWYRIHQKLPILYFHTLLCIFLWNVRFLKIKVTQHFQIFISPPTSLSIYIHDCGCLVNMFNFFFLNCWWLLI